MKERELFLFYFIIWGYGRGGRFKAESVVCQRSAATAGGCRRLPAGTAPGVNLCLYRPGGLGAEQGEKKYLNRRKSFIQRKGVNLHSENSTRMRSRRSAAAQSRSRVRQSGGIPR